MKKIIFFTLILAVLILISTALADIITDGIVIDGVDINKETAFIMPLGDSITDGNAAILSDGIAGYREYLYNLMVANNIPVRFVGPKNNYEQNIGTFGEHAGDPGDRTDEIEARTLKSLESRMPVANPPIESYVLLHAGTNDINQSKVEADIVQNIEDIINIIHAHDPAINIYVALIVPNAGGGATDAAITSYNTALSARITSLKSSLPKSNLYEVDMNAAFRDSGKCATVSTCMADNIHPNITGYSVMAQEWATAILANR